MLGRAGQLLIANGILYLLAMVAAAVIARELGPQGTGSYQAIVRWISMAAIVASVSLGHAAAFHSSGLDERGLKTLVGTSISVSLVQGTLLAVVGYFLAPALLSDVAPADAVRFAMLWLPINLASTSLAHLARARLRVGVFNSSRLISALVFLVVAYVGLGSGAGLDSVVVAVVLASFAGLLVLASYFAAHHWLAWKFDRADLERSVPYALKVHPGVVARELNLYLDQLVISLLLPSRALGLYASAVSAAAALRLGSSVFVYMAQGEAQAAPTASAGAVVAALVRGGLILMLPLALILTWLMPFAISTVYGEEFREAVAPATVLCFATVIEGTVATLAAALVGLGRAAIATVAQVGAASLTAMLLIVALPTGGLVAAAWISLATYCLAAVIMALHISRSMHVPLRDFVVPTRRDGELARAYWRMLRSRMTQLKPRSHDE